MAHLDWSIIEDLERCIGRNDDVSVVVFPTDCIGLQEQFFQFTKTQFLYILEFFLDDFHSPRVHTILEFDYFPASKFLNLQDGQNLIELVFRYF